MKSCLTLLLFTLLNCSGESSQELVATGGDCIYDSPESGTLRYVGAEKLTDTLEQQNDLKYLVEFEVNLDSAPSDHRHQSLTLSCKSEFELKKQTSVQITRIQWGSCIPIRISPLELSAECSKQFIGNDF